MSYQKFSEVLETDIDLRRRMSDFSKLRRAVYEMDHDDLKVIVHDSSAYMRSVTVFADHTCSERAYLQIQEDITSIDEAERTAEAAAMQEKINRVYQTIQEASAKSMAADTHSANRYAISETEQMQLRLFQVETSVLKIHELCHQMAQKVGVEASAVEKFKPMFVPGHNQDCL